MTPTPQPDATALGASQTSMALLRNWAEEKKWDKVLPYAHRLMASGCRDAEVFRTLANLFGVSNRRHLAAFFGELAVEYGDRQNADLLARLGNWYSVLGDLRRARECYSRALVVDPSRQGYRYRSAMVVSPVVKSNEQIRIEREELQTALAHLLAHPPLVQDPRHECDVPGYFLSYHGENNRQIRQTFVTAILKSAPWLAARPMRSAGRTPAHRLRLAFVSSLFYVGSVVDKVTRGIVRNLDRDRFELHIFATKKKDINVQPYIEACDQFHWLQKDLLQAGQQIAEQRPDVLIFPELGMSRFMYYLGFQRIAPVQCTFWGHPETSGIPNMDYFISSELVEPADGQEHYSEKLIRLTTRPDFFYRPSPVAVETTRGDVGLSEADHVYACLQAAFKLHPDFDVILAAILERDPRASVLLSEPHEVRWKEILMQRFSANGLKDRVERIKWLPQMEHARYLAHFRLADVVLDPLHFGSGITAYDAFAMGCPIITMPGGFARGRVVQSLYQMMNISDYIAGDSNSYVETAICTARNWKSTPGRRAMLAERTKVIFENQAAITELSDCLVDLHRRHSVDGPVSA